MANNATQTPIAKVHGHKARQLGVSPLHSRSTPSNALMLFGFMRRIPLPNQWNDRREVA